MLFQEIFFHYNDVVMNAMVSQITGVSIICSTVGLGADQRKHQSSASLTLFEGNSPVTDEFPAQKASNAENVSIWWRHHSNTAIWFYDAQYILGKFESHITINVIYTVLKTFSIFPHTNWLHSGPVAHYGVEDFV